MTHRVALYTVQVRRKWDTRRYLPLGDIDEAGTGLSHLLIRYLDKDFEAVNDDGTRTLHCEGSAFGGGNDLLAMFQHGLTGVAANIIDKEGAHRIRQSVDDTSRVGCGAVLRLPPASDIGWLAAHIPHGRGAKGLMEKGIQARFRPDFPDLVLEITPFVSGSVLLTAVEQGRVQSVRLTRLDQSSDRAGAGKWVREGAEAKIELTIKPRGQIKRLLSQLPLDFLRGNSDAFGQIVQFDGMTFDEVKLEVVLSDGSQRTFNIERPEAGHPYTEDLDIQMMRHGQNAGQPGFTSIWEGLRGALDRSLSNVPG